MSVRRRWLEAAPPLLVGLVGAVTVEASAGLLLYTADGLLPALTLILTVEMGALGLGIVSAPLPISAGYVEQLRRRWMFSLVAFALAAALSAGLSFLDRFSGSGLGQGVGLAFLGGLPMFSLGTVLGVMSRPSPGREGPLSHVGTSAVFGAALGFLLAGSLLLPNAAPYTLYLFCLVLLSGGALLQGWLLDEHEALETQDSKNERVGGGRGFAWEVSLAEYLEALEDGTEAVLLLGGGGGDRARVLSLRLPETEIEVVEKVTQLGTLGRSFPLIIADSGALAHTDRVPYLEESDWQCLADALVPHGMLVIGGLDMGAQEGSSLANELAQEAGDWLPGRKVYQRDPCLEGREGGLEGAAVEKEFLLFLSKSEDPRFPLGLPGFSPRTGGGN